MSGHLEADFDLTEDEHISVRAGDLFVEIERLLDSVVVKVYDARKDRHDEGEIERVEVFQP